MTTLARLQAISERIEFASGLRERVKLVSRSTANPQITRHTMSLGGKKVGSMETHAGRLADSIKSSWVDPKFRGMGLGKKLYGDVLRKSPGGALFSDSSVSPRAERVYKSMAQRPKSYSVVTQTPDPESFDPRFKIVSKAPAPPPRTPAEQQALRAGQEKFIQRRDVVLKKWDDRRWRISAKKAAANPGFL